MFDRDETDKSQKFVHIIANIKNFQLLQILHAIDEWVGSWAGKSTELTMPQEKKNLSSKFDFL